MAYDFDTIARDYDRLNRIMSLGLDRRWRKRAAHEVESGKWKAESVLDVACGTGDMVLELQKHGCSVTGVDLSEEMIAIAKQKTASATSHLSPLTFHLGDAEALPFAEGEFDAVTCAFGVRNFVHLEQGLSEMLRVLKPGGRMVILELATPDSPLIRPFYNLYTRHIIPWLGQHLAGSREAYTYLPTSIERFPKGDAFLRIIQNSKFKIQNCRHRRLTFGVCRMYTVVK
jgi:demethylmenaquinone methyltransferase/2-methoxy-6-polyprenyl-1,4-benzoquinol methylase